LSKPLGVGKLPCTFIETFLVIQFSISVNEGSHQLLITASTAPVGNVSTELHDCLANQTWSDATG
jgi:hypothetical protein